MEFFLPPSGKPSLKPITKSSNEELQKFGSIKLHPQNAMPAGPVKDCVRLVGVPYEVQRRDIQKILNVTHIERIALVINEQVSVFFFILRLNYS